VEFGNNSIIEITANIRIPHRKRSARLTLSYKATVENKKNIPSCTIGDVANIYISKVPQKPVLSTAERDVIIAGALGGLERTNNLRAVITASSNNIVITGQSGASPALVASWATLLESFNQHKENCKSYWWYRLRDSKKGKRRMEKSLEKLIFFLQYWGTRHSVQGPLCTMTDLLDTIGSSLEPEALAFFGMKLEDHPYHSSAMIWMTIFNNIVY
jgi:hypothetical protein